ncbi:putative pumilio 8, chloroplastic [Haematococcus lacustris]|uniref:Putative pumilio 8, chloroplastic n=1 Tax=Haematococcus lacustris TaxID=44745 RepID=A0A699ZYN3_HAELA|nr:putative pumilio 8, chloroplastic [Haematococcus lacustris]
MDLAALVLRRVAQRGELASVALNTHGTRAVQKLIETLSSREQRQIVVEALRGGE